MTTDNETFSKEFAVEIKRLEEFVCHNGPANKDELKEFSSLLSILLSFGEKCPNEATSYDGDDPPEIDRKELQQRISARFPDFGYYNSCVPNDSFEKPDISVGDATDDILDIVTDLKETLWYIENGNRSLGLWHANLLLPHWGRHAIDLISYLHKKIHDW